MDNEKLTSGETVKNTDAPVEQEVTNEATVADVIGDDLETEHREEERHDSIPLAKFLDVKNQNKELKQQLTELQSRAQEMTTAQISDDLGSLAQEHNIDPAFLGKLASVIKKQAEKDLDARLKPIADKERRDRINAAFEKTYKDVMTEMPEYADIANPEVIKALSLQPSNRNKTFRQIVEETYGNAISGRRTIESTSVQPKTAGPLDYAKAVKDPSYFKEVMADPKLKAEYNSKMLQDSM